MPHAGLSVYTSLFCGVDYDGLLFLFLHAAFWICGFVRSVFGLMILFLFMLANFRLWLAEFRSCGSDQPFPKPKGWTPTLFSLGAGLLVLCP